jgi:ABC-type multidrug transport system fused ATPase/permease subunit
MIEIVRKVMSFFESKDKMKLWGIFVGIMLMGFVEMSGVAAILPFMAVATNPDLIQSNHYLSTINQYFAFSSNNAFLLFLGGIVFTLLLFGNLFSAFITWCTMRFCYLKGKEISTDLLKKYLSQPYIFFLNKNSSELSKNILAEVDRLVTGIFINGMQSISKVTLIACIFVLLIIIEPWLALTVMAVFGGAYLLIYRIIRKKLATAGKMSSAVNGVRYQLIDESLGAIKELKVLGREQNFLKTYENSALLYAKAETLSQLSPLMAKYTIEVIAFGSMLIMALFLIATHEDMSKFIPLLGLYALSGYRLMPAMQQLFSGYALFRYHESALDILCQETKLSQSKFDNHSQRMPFLKTLELSQVSYRYPEAQSSALSQISLSIKQHTTIGFVGSSGAGKTTLVDIILGLLLPQGKLEVDGQIINENNVREWQRNIGYVPQGIFLLDGTITNNIAIGVPSDAIDMAAVKRAAELANLDEFIMKQLPQGYETKVGERGVRLSGGQRQRIGIARALYHDPELLIFDEATSALDGITEKVIMEAIHSLAKRKTIILIAHRLNTVKDCDMIYLFNHGEIVGKGSYEQLISTNKIFQHLANAYV